MCLYTSQFKQARIWINGLGAIACAALYRSWYSVSLSSKVAMIRCNISGPLVAEYSVASVTTTGADIRFDETRSDGSNHDFSLWDTFTTPSAPTTGSGRHGRDDAMNEVPSLLSLHALKSLHTSRAQAYNQVHAERNYRALVRVSESGLQFRVA
jgi:hypothetical protein